MTDWAKDFEWIARQCRGSVYLTINEHKSCYHSVEKEIECMKSLDETEVIDSDVLAVMKKKDTMVTLQAYPNTPVGFCRVIHHNIGEAVREMRRILQ